MRDVFKFLKDSRKLLESKEPSEASVRAKELGYVYNYGQGTWRDPVSKRKYRFENGRFEEIQTDLPQRMDRAGAKLEKEPKTYSQFKQEIPTQDEPVGIEEPPVSNQMGRVVPGGPTETAISSGDKKEVVKQLSRGRGSVQSPARKKQVSQQADDMIAQDELETELETQDEIDVETQEPEGLDDLLSDIRDEEPQKSPEEFKSINQAVEETGKNVDGSERVGDVDIATEESINRVREISNTDVNDQRFDQGRQAQKEFLDHYSKDSEYRDGLNTLSKSIAKGNDRKKVEDMMSAVDNGDYLREIELKKGDKRTVSELLLDAGIDVNNQEQIDCFKNAYKEINSFVGENGNWKTSETNELVGSNLGYYEAKHIAERNDLKELDPAGVQTKAYNTRNETDSSMQCVTPEITDVVYSLLPTPSRDYLSKSGSPKTFYDPREKNSQGKPNPIRGSAGLHMYIMQDGRDAYTSSGRRRSPGEFQVEHITPLKSGGTDSIDNFAQLLRRVNEPRADLPLEKFQEQAKRKAKDVEADLSSPKNRRRMETAYRASAFNSKLSSSVGGPVSSLTSDDLMESVNKGLEDSLGSQASKPLKVTPEAFKQYKSEMKGFLDKNGLDSDATIKDMSSEQINGVFDIMSENLGVSKTKMNDYMGRNLINNYDVGGRTVINKDGKLERGRGGTAPSSGNIINMQNSIFSDDTLSPEEKEIAIQTANQHHQKIKKSRNEYIDNPDSAEAYENYLGDIVTQIGYLTGDGDSPLKKGRKYDTRLTPSPKNNIDNDTYSGIMNMLSLDSASVSGGKDAFSPGFQETPLSPKAKEYVNTLRQKMIESFSKQSGFNKNQIDNPDSLTKTQRKKIEPILNAIENIERGLEK